MSKTIKGGDVMAFISEGSEFKSLAFCTNSTLTINAGTTEISSKDNGGKWTDSDVTSLDWSVSSDSFMSADGEGVTYDTLVDKMLATTVVDIVFSEKSTTQATLDEVPEGGWTPSTGKVFKGKAIITSVSISANNGDTASYSITFTGKGKLTHATL